MIPHQPRYSKEDHARRGTELYEQQVRPQVEAGNHGKIVAIDVDSGDFEVADNGLNAAERLYARHPDAQIWCVRIGYPAVYQFGAQITGSDAIRRLLISWAEIDKCLWPQRGRSVT